MSEHDAPTAHDMALVGAQWLTSNPQVRERAVAGCTALGKTPVDAFVTDPAQLVDAVRSLVLQAVELDAPVGVVEALLPVLRPMVATLNESERWRFSLDAMARLEGLRDKSEVVPAVEGAIADAPDEANGGRLRAGLDAFQRAITPDVELEPADVIRCLACDIKGGIDDRGCPICLLICEIMIGNGGHLDPFPGPGPKPI